MRDNYSVIVTYQDKGQASNSGTWAMIMRWLVNQNPGLIVTGVTIQRISEQRYREYIAPIETGEPFRSAAEIDWNSSRE